MAASSKTLSVSVPSRGDSRSPSPVLNRQPSRSPQPYRRRQRHERLPFSRPITHPFTPALTPSPVASGTATPQRSSVGGSESGTEADDELTRRLPAPPGWKHISSEDYVWDEESKDRRGRRRRRNEASRKQGRSKRRGITVLRRSIEVALVAVLAVVVLMGKEQRALKEILLRRKEILCWLIPFVALILAYPIRVLLCNGSLQPPRSLDPSALLYPTLFPVLVALSLTPTDAEISNSFLLANLVISISNLPPILTTSWDLHWLLSLAPLFSQSNHASISDTLLFITPINTTLTSALTNILYPSLTPSELRLLSSALINLLFHALSPQAIILRALIWGGGIAVFLLCEDVIRWNVSLTRIPIHRLRRAGNAILGISRLRRLVGLREIAWRAHEQASDSEAEVIFNRRPTTSRKSSFFITTLTRRGASIRHLGYTACVYCIILGIVLLGLRPYIGTFALEGVDPFIWAPGYIFCGQDWYQKLVDRISPGMGYCVTAGSTRAANIRLGIIGLWAVILTIGLTFVTIFAPQLEVDTRRKVFHGMVIPMFLIPGLFDPPFTHLCLSLAVAVFLLCDLLRAGQLPPASKYIAKFLQPYVDGRDLKGPMVVSHVFLLVGAGVGWWLTLAAHPQYDWDWDAPLELTFSSGVACVGLGDAAASLIGRKFGKHKWGWKGGKSIEGSLAFMVAVISGMGVARLWIVGFGGNWSPEIWGKLILAGAWGSMLEAVVTGVNDNVVVPIGVWIVVHGLGL